MLWIRRSAGLWIAATTVAVLCAVSGGGVARAGEYHVYSCRMPGGQVAPTDGWSGSAAGSFVSAENKCQKGGALVAELEDGVEHESTDISTWTFSAPEDETLANVNLWRAGDADGGLAKSGTYEFWLAGPNENEAFDECVYGGSQPCVAGKGEAEEPFAPENKLLLSRAHLGSHLYVNAACFATLGLCKKGEHNPGGYAAVVYLYAADLVLEQSSQPTVGNVEGELADAPTLSGAVDLSLHAEDAGSGVYLAVFSVDGTEVARTVLDEDGGRCRNVGQTTDGLPAFLYLQPCLPSLNADLPFDTDALADGTHHLVVSVTNAAGDSTVALDRRITVLNHPSVPTTPQQPSPEGQGPTGVAKNEPSPSSTTASQPHGDNGTNASAGATLRVRWSATAHASLAGAYGRAQTVLGRLTAPDGAAIGGASVQVLSTPSFQGAQTLALATARTAADGSFRVRLPAATPSSRITFAYASHSGQAAPDVTAALILTVPARLSLDVAPRVSHAGGTIHFHGTLAGGPLPPGGKQLVLEARTPGGSWRQFQALSTLAHGRYRASYRFRLGGPVTYEFRAVSPKEADFPFAAGASNIVRVHER
jgi:hypothetical protein